LRIIVVCTIHLILIGFSDEGGRDLWDMIKTGGKRTENVWKVIVWKPEGKLIS
jgi:hypothetical protein